MRRPGAVMSVPLLCGLSTMPRTPIAATCWLRGPAGRGADLLRGSATALPVRAGHLQQPRHRLRRPATDRPRPRRTTTAPWPSILLTPRRVSIVPSRCSCKTTTGADWRSMSGAVPAGTRNAGVGRTAVGRIGDAGQDAAGVVRAGSGGRDPLLPFRALLAERGLRVFIQAPAALVRLLRSLRGVAGVIGPDESVPGLDVHAPVMSLPRLWGMASWTMRPVPCPTCQPTRLLLPLAGPWSGLERRSWSAWPGAATRLTQAIAPAPSRAAAFAPLAAVPGVRVVSLMKEATPEERAARGRPMSGRSAGRFRRRGRCRRQPGPGGVGRYGRPHLAGALGVPLWIALPSAPDWRWGLSRADSPWYPTARLFRQECRGDWNSVLGCLGAELERCRRTFPDRRA